MRTTGGELLLHWPRGVIDKRGSLLPWRSRRARCIEDEIKKGRVMREIKGRTDKEVNNAGKN